MLNAAGTPPSCNMCSLSDVNMDTNIAINVTAISNNKIADAIQNELKSKLEEMVTNKTEGGIGLTDSQVSAITKLKTYVETNFNTEIINKTLNNYTFTQSLNAENQNVSRINMKLTGTVLGTAMIENAVKHDSSVQSLIDAVVTTTADTSGFNFSLFGGAIGTLIFIAIIFYVVTRFNIFSIFSRTSSNTQVQQQSPPLIVYMDLPANGVQPYQQSMDFPTG